MGEPLPKRFRSKQDYGTPPEFLAAVEARFGPMDWDLACSGPSNARAPRFFTREHDSLSMDWTALSGNLWLNPPFSRIDPWAGKSRASANALCSRRIFLLTPASIGSEWFAEHVHGIARVIALRPRLKFVGCKDPYPKDCTLSIFGDLPGFELWAWRRKPLEAVA